MDMESQDPVTVFCQAYILQNDQRPKDESKLAEAFVKHFSIPFLTTEAGLKDFLVGTNIVLIEDDSPDHPLGAYVCDQNNGIIETSTNAHHVPFQLHTVLHEIREIIEFHFKRLGFPTANSSELESRADQFAFWVPIYAAVGSADRTFCDVSEANAQWKNWASDPLLGICALLYCLLSFYGAFGYRFQGVSVKEVKHI